MTLPKEIAPGLLHVSGIAVEDIDPHSLAVIAKVRDENWRLPFWLAYHRWLGVDHFIVIDNRSTDGTPSLLTSQHDVTLVSAPGPFRPNASQPDAPGYRSWIGNILQMSPPTRWNLVLDADELMVAAPWRQGGLRQTVCALEAGGAEVAYALMIDCYPESLPPESDAVSATPWIRAPWFDPGPYGRWRNRARKLRVTYCGVRERLCWPDWKYQKYLPSPIRKLANIKPPPFILKVPLIKGGVDGSRGIHTTPSQKRANCYFNLLHYKFDVDLPLKVRTALAEKQYFDASQEYERYAAALDQGELHIRTPASRKFTGLNSLIDAGLCRYDAEFLARVSAGRALDTPLDRALDEIRQHDRGDFVEAVSISGITEALGRPAP